MLDSERDDECIGFIMNYFLSLFFHLSIIFLSEILLYFYILTSKTISSNKFYLIETSRET